MKAIYLLPVLFLAAMMSAVATDPTIVNGHVYQEGGHAGVPNILVTVTCLSDHNPQPVKTDMTNTHGFYAVEFTPEECVPGDTIKICAGDNENNCDTAVVTDTTFWKNIVYVNLEIPEFTWVAAGVALIGAGLGFMLLRKKN